MKKLTGFLCAFVLVFIASSVNAQYTITDLGLELVPYDINNNGQVCGYATSNTGDAHAFLYDNGTMTDLGTLGGRYSWGRGINEKGQIVGISWPSASTLPHAFLYENGIMTDLGTFGGGNTSSAYKINDNSQAVGNSGGSAVLYENGSIIGLGSFGGVSSNAYDINNSGQIVGYSYLETGYEHACLWENEIMTEVNSSCKCTTWCLPEHFMW